MLTLVHLRASKTSPVDSASLAADYLAFDRRRTLRRQYMKAFGGMAILVLVGAAFGRVPVGEAWIVAGLLASPPLVLAAVEAIQWNRLVGRLERLREDIRASESRKKLIRRA